MTPSQRPIQIQRMERALRFLRAVTATLLGIHGGFRAVTGGAFHFGQALSEMGFPIGTAIAWSITLVELFGMLCLFLGRLVVPVCLGQIFILTMGVILVHGREGWFVVGGGRNGVEYSVLLICCLGALCSVSWPIRSRPQTSSEATTSR